MYSEQEYQLYLHDDAWTKAETDHLFDLSRRFDLRFVVIHDRYDHQQFKVSWYSLACVPNPRPSRPLLSGQPLHMPLSVLPPSPSPISLSSEAFRGGLEGTVLPHLC